MIDLRNFEPVLIADSFPLHHFVKYITEQDRSYSEGPCLIWTGALGGRGLYGTFSWVIAGEHFQRASQHGSDA
jgi:hypothetical protein